MKKVLIGSAIFLGTVLVLWTVARITGMLQYYVIPSAANEPTLKIGDKLFTTNLKRPKPHQFIAFTSKYQDSVLAGYNNGDFNAFKPGAHYLYRLCGIGGDTLEMKNAILYVNGKNFDEELNLKYEFEITAKAFNEIVEDEDKPAEGSYSSPLQSKDSMTIAFDKTQIKKYQSRIKLTPFIVNDTTNGPFKWLDKNTTWTTDNFGPLAIPAGCYFSLGDNRHNAMDSRFTGFIKQADIKGVVLNK
ncbi:signal peptidase I [Ferruginibacter sp. SUN106]|uniref:signal peptidase I n=1 Tax=Ferruginibacter sp. SUN106 TaxID=2978348 RepID=UPI003D36E020